MSLSTTMTVRLPKKTQQMLERLAKSTHRSRSFLATEAIETYLKTNAWQVQEIEEAVREADHGGSFVSHTAVKHRVHSWK